MPLISFGQNNTKTYSSENVNFSYSNTYTTKGRQSTSIQIISNTKNQHGVSDLILIQFMDTEIPYNESKTTFSDLFDGILNMGIQQSNNTYDLSDSDSVGSILSVEKKQIGDKKIVYGAGKHEVKSMDYVSLSTYYTFNINKKTV